jgi:hypothetical protein
MKKINGRMHGVIDYATALAWFIGPTLLQVKGGHSNVFKAISVMLAGLNLTTKYPLGVKKTIPMGIRQELELFSVLFFLFMGLNPKKTPKGARFLYLASAAQMFTMATSRDLAAEAIEEEAEAERLVASANVY